MTTSRKWKIAGRLARAALRNPAPLLTLLLALGPAGGAHADTGARYGCDVVSDLRHTLRQIDRAPAEDAIPSLRERMAGIGDTLDRAEGRGDRVERQLGRIAARLRAALATSGPDAVAAIRREARSLSTLAAGLGCNARVDMRGAGTISDGAVRPGEKRPERIKPVPPATSQVRALFDAVQPEQGYARAAALHGAVVALAIAFYLCAKRLIERRRRNLDAQAGNRRHNPRYPCDVPCHVATRTRELVETACKNVSVEGCGLLVWDGAEKGDLCDVFVAGQWRPATVRWRGQNLVGLLFADPVTEDDIDAILVETLERE